MATQVPVVVLAGFPGVGTTTLLDQLSATSDVRLAVVDDSGAAGLDERLVALTRRRASALDAIVVEVGGSADPAAVVRRVLASRVPGVAYAGLVVAVDAVGFDAALRRHPVLADHVGMADVVLLTRTDLVEAGAVEALLARCRDLNPWAPVVPAARGEVDVRLLPGRPPRHPPAPGDAVTFTSGQPLDPRRFLAFLDARPSGVFSVEGSVHFAVRGHGQRFVLHSVGAAVRFERTAWPAGQPPRTEVVCGGAGLDAAALLAQLQACVHGGDLLDEAALVGVLRRTDAG